MACTDSELWSDVPRCFWTGGVLNLYFKTAFSGTFCCKVPDDNNRKKRNPDPHWHNWHSGTRFIQVSFSADSFKMCGHFSQLCRKTFALWEQKTCSKGARFQKKPIWILQACLCIEKCIASPLSDCPAFSENTALHIFALWSVAWVKSALYLVHRLWTAIQPLRLSSNVLHKSAGPHALCAEVHTKRAPLSPIDSNLCCFHLILPNLADCLALRRKRKFVSCWNCVVFEFHQLYPSCVKPHAKFEIRQIWRILTWLFGLSGTHLH